MKNLSSINESQDIVNKKYVDELAETKVDKVDGKGLSTNDFTNEEKEKLSGLENYTLPKASTDALGGIKIGSGLSVFEDGTVAVAGGSGKTEVAVQSTEPTDTDIVIWVDNSEEAEAISMLNYKGLYDTSVEYNPNDLVYYNNTWYMCHATITGTAPSDNGFSDGYWYPIGGVCSTPTNNQQVTNKEYVDTTVNNSVSDKASTDYVDTAVNTVSESKISNGNGVVTDVWTGTQDEYDAIATKNATTLYLIKG